MRIITDKLGDVSFVCVARAPTFCDAVLYDMHKVIIGAYLGHCVFESINWNWTVGLDDMVIFAQDILRGN